MNSKKFSINNANTHLSHAYGESRYFRNWTNGVFNIFLTIYIGSLSLQISHTLDDKAKMPLLIFLVTSFLFVTIILLRYHNLHGGWQEVIYKLKKEYLHYPDEFIENKSYINFQKKSYLKKIFTGKGHIEFISYLLLLLIINILLLFSK